ncbi:10744_t:CDS:2 [Gigaspora margarita]|uniref:10744_t:CDS:1 n=1 Tax=Gigaspora margarita TaxID=4874 RepID=A0ABM8W171_GIGMA|nr:10744_t:CDS:2 [Gigaspora margarita]
MTELSVNRYQTAKKINTKPSKLRNLTCTIDVLEELKRVE